MIAAISTTFVRVAVIGGAMLGGAVGAFVAFVKLIPERVKIVVGYQGEVLDDLRNELKRVREAHAEEIDALKIRIALLETKVVELELEP